MENKKDIKNICWKNFEKTGKIPYYLLYKNLEKQKEEKLDGKFNNNKSNSLESNPFSR